MRHGLPGPPYTFATARRSCRKYNIKGAGEGSGLNPIRRRQGDRHGLTLARIPDTGVKTISGVQPLASHIHLRHKLVPAGCPDSKVDVGRAPGISDRPNGAETVRTIRTGRHATIPLKSRVAGPFARVRRVQVAAVRVALPNLDRGIRDRLSVSSRARAP